MKIFLQFILVLIPILSFAQNNNGVHTEGSINGLIDNFNIKLYSIQTGGVKVETDGARAKFGATYCACVDGDDAPKFMGSGIESISLLRDGVSLVIEARPYITAPDTIYIKMEGMNIGGSYEFQITPTNFDTSVAVCRVYDHFLNTDTIISLSTASSLPFDVTAATGSDASDRFSIVFYPTVILPIQAINTNVFKQNNTIVINWQTTNENDIKIYEIEKSIDGFYFTKLNTIDAKNGNANNKYSLIDNTPVNGNNYYRIKTIQLNKNSYYSNIFSINYKLQAGDYFSTFPNPVRSSIIGVQLNNIENGDYQTRLINSMGKQVFGKRILFNGSNENINLLHKPANGLYTLQLIDKNGKCFQQNVLIAE